MPLSFEPNRGQTASYVQFLSRGQGYNLGLAPDRATLILHKPLARETDRAVLRWQLVGANAQARGEALDPQIGRSNYLRGRDARGWVTNVPHFGRVAYHNVYPGIDVVYYGTSQRQLEFDFVVAPRANPGVIELAFQGGVTRLDQGRLVIETLGGPVFHEAPVLYQRIGGTTRPVSGGFAPRGLNRIGFQVGAYDPSHPLYIDPVLNYSSYLGGSGADDGQAVAVDTAGGTYLTGSTDSANFPISGELYSAQGGLDAFVTKLDSTGTVIVYSTYLGGGLNDEGRAIAVDVSGNAYVTGRTSSTNFPLGSPAIPYQGALSGTQDAFVAKLSAAGNDLLYSTYLGGSGANEEGRGIAADVFGNIYVTGVTDSSGATPFPTTGSAYRTTNQGGTDAFITKLNPLNTVTTAQLLYSTYLGGAANDEAKALALDNGGKVYVTGITASTNFPTVNPYQSSNLGGTSDAFLAKIDPGLSGAASLTYGSYLGGAATDEGRGIAVDVYQQVYVAGHTTSSSFFHPMSGYQTTFGGVADAFVAKLDLSQTGVLQRKYQSFLGGNQSDSANAIAVDGYGNAYVTGQTAGSFPLQDAWQGTYGGGPADAFVTQFNGAGSALVYSSYLGGTDNDLGKGIVAGFDGQRTDSLPSSQFVANVVVTGMTASPNFPTSRSFQGPGGGASDAFVSRVSLMPGAPAFTGISPDTGISTTDQITPLAFESPLTLNGTADPNNQVTIRQSGKGVLGTATANGSRVWSFVVTAPNYLSEGVHAFTATATPSVSDTLHASEPSATFLVTIDNTPPTVTLSVPTSTTDVTPLIRVTASDLFGLPNDSTDTNYQIRLEIDSVLTNTYAMLKHGYAIFEVQPPLSVASHQLKVYLKDKAGNAGESLAVNVNVTAATTWSVTGEALSFDPLDGDSMVQTGNVQVTHNLDLDLSPGSASFGQPALVYNSETVDVRPIVKATIQSRNDGPLPATLPAQLTWNGTVQPPVAPAHSTAGRSPGEALAIAVQYVPPSPLATGRYPWSLTVTTPAGNQTASGAAFVVNRQSSPFGAGWSASLTDELVDILDQGTGLPAGKLRVFGTGGWRFYAWNGSGYDSPAGDAGKLTCSVSICTYRHPDGRKWIFDTGRQTSWVSATADDTITFGYDTSTPPRLTGVTMPDGGVSTWSYANPLLPTITAPGCPPGCRVWSLTIDNTTDNKLAQIGNPDSNARTFAYSSDTNFSHNLVSAALGTTSWSWAYGSHGRLTSYTVGSTSDGAATTTTVTPAVVQGLTPTAVVSPLAAKATDGLGHETRTTMDARGRFTEHVAGDGGVWKWTRDALTTWVTGITNPRGQTTSYERDSVGYVTLVTFPQDPIGTVGQQSYTYDDGPVDNPRHRLIAFKDERNFGSAFQYTLTYYTVGEGDVNGGRHLKSITDPLPVLPGTTNYVWDWSKGRLQTLTNARGFQTVFETDTNRRVNNIREADNDGTAKRNTTITYVSASAGAGAGEVESRITGQSVLGAPYAKPSTSNYTYDLMNRLTQSVDAAGAPEQRTTNWTYTPDGLVETMTTGQGTPPAASNAATMVYQYDTAGRQNRVIEAAETPFRRQTLTYYDPAGNPVIVFDPRGRAVQWYYDGANRVVQSSEALGMPQQRDVWFGYDLAGNRTSAQDSLGRVTQFEYSNRNRVTRMDEALFNATEHRWATFTYDAAGNITSRMRGQANVRPHVATDAFLYDRLNRVEKATEASGSSVADVTDFTYDEVGSVKTVHEHAPAGSRTDFTYDGLNRRKTTNEGANSANTYEKRNTTFSYDAADNLTKRETKQLDDATRVYRTDFGYDSLRRVTSRVEAVGQLEQRTTTVLYDAASNLLQVTQDFDPTVPEHEYLRTRYGYDLHNRRTQVTVAYTTTLARTTAAAYDDADQVVAVTDPLSQTTRYGHDDLSRHTHTVDALGKLTKLTRDAANNVVALTDPVGNVSRWVVDALNRVTKDTDPLNNSRTFIYNAADDLVSRIDREDREITWTYDERDRVTNESWVNGNRSADYDYDLCDCLAGILIAVGPGASAVAFQHDLLKRPRTVTVQDSGGLMTSQVVFNREHYANNVMKTEKVQIGVTYDHTDTNTSDFLGRVTQIKRNGGNGSGDQLLKVDLTYNFLGQLKEVKRYDGISTTVFSTSAYVYDKATRLTSIDHKIGTTTHAAYTLAYDAADRVAQQIVTYGSSTTTNYGYDATNQLTSESIVGGGTTTYAYDASGNRTGGSYQTGTANRLAVDGEGYSYTYDREGNVKTRSKPSANDYQEFDWDYHNLLTEVRFYDKPAGDPTRVLVKKETYRYDILDRRIGKTSTVSGGTTTYQFVWDGDHVRFVYTDSGAQPSNRYLHGPAIDQVLADEQLTGTAGRLWALTDHLGSVRDVINTTTNVKHRVYDGFGKLTSETGSATFVFGFTGREFDAVVDLQYNRARYYDPRIGRWMSEDPIRFQARDASLYRYVGNIPTVYTDPSGELLFPLLLIGFALFAFTMPNAAQAPGPNDPVHRAPAFDLPGVLPGTVFALIGACGWKAADFIMDGVGDWWNGPGGGGPPAPAQGGPPVPGNPPPAPGGGPGPIPPQPPAPPVVAPPVPSTQQLAAECAKGLRGLQQQVDAARQLQVQAVAEGNFALADAAGTLVARLEEQLRQFRVQFHALLETLGM